MTAASRLVSIERGLNGIARKVLEAVPIAEAWTQQQVMAEMKRLHGTAQAFDVVQGSLSHLAEVGLVKHTAGLYQRVAVKRTLTTVQSMAREAFDGADEGGVDIDAAHKNSPPLSPIDKLANLGATAREMSRALARLADEIDAAAIEVDEQVKEAGAGSEKLRQLRELLAGLK